MKKEKTKYYAVKVGNKPGIYNTWEECLVQVNGYTGAIYKSFKTLAEANEFLNSDTMKKTSKKKVSLINNESINVEIENKINKLKSNEAIAFVDGSYMEDKELKRVGFGVLLIHQGSKTKLSGIVKDEELLQYRNVTGEIYACKNAIIWAINNNIKTLTIYYDYEGIRSWAKGLWKANNSLTTSYVKFIDEYKNLIKVNFEKVKAHSGISYNEIVDELAKDAILKEFK